MSQKDHSNVILTFRLNLLLRAWSQLAKLNEAKSMLLPNLFPNFWRKRFTKWGNQRISFSKWRPQTYHFGIFFLEFCFFTVNGLQLKLKLFEKILKSYVFIVSHQCLVLFLLECVKSKDKAAESLTSHEKNLQMGYLVWKTFIETLQLMLNLLSLGGT